MSTWLGIDGSGHAKLHMTSDTKTAAQLAGDPVSTTVFHTDLPYVFAREQFEITSYTTWAGGRKFALPSALQTFKQNNPYLAYLLILTDSSGNEFIHDPVTWVCASNWRDTWPAGQNINIVAALAINGADYQSAYTSSDAQLSALTENSWNPAGGSYSFTFRTWDTSDTHVTIFRTPWLPSYSNYGIFPKSSYDYAASPMRYFVSDNNPNPLDLTSSGNDIVKVRFVFLNIIHSPTTFSRQAGFNYDFVRIDPTNFTVNDVELNNYAPVISHGFNTSGTTITKYTSGKLASGKAIGVNMSTTKINTSNQITGGNSAVLEIPPEVTGSIGWEIDLANQTIDRNGVNVFSSSWIGKALRVSGTKEISFNMSTTLYDSNSTYTVSSTQSGNLGSVDSDTVYLASVVVDENGSWNVLHSTSIFSAGDNMLAFFTLGMESSGWWGNDLAYYLNISTSGTCTIYGRRWRCTAVPSYYQISSVGLTFPDMKIRLIALTTG